MRPRTSSPTLVPTWAPTAAPTKGSWVILERKCKQWEYESRAPTRVRGRACSPVLNCTDSQYQAQAPVWRANVGYVTDRTCSWLANCTETEFEQSPPVGHKPTTVGGHTQLVADRVCKETKKCHKSLEYETAAPEATRDRECTALRVSVLII